MSVGVESAPQTAKVQDGPVGPVRDLRHVPELDGIRGLAALGVFFHHVCYTSVQAAGWPKPIVWLYGLSAWGSRGVDLFFALSGFLITSVLLGDRRSSRYYQDFYWKRALRILPLYTVCLLGMLVFLHQPAYVALSAVFLVNFASVLHVQGIGPLWTLAIEEQFYVLWPTVVRRKTVTQVGRFAMGLGITAIGLRYAFALKGHHNYYLTFLRCDGLAFGALLACHFHLAGENERLRRGWDLGLAGVAVMGLALAFWPTLNDARALDAATLQTGTTLLSGALIGLAISRSGAAAMGALRSRAMVFFGLISYAFYMVHLFVLEGYDHWRGGLPAGDVAGYWIRFGVVLGVTVGLCLASRYAIELPAIGLRRFVLKHPAAGAEHARPPLPLAPM